MNVSVEPGGKLFQIDPIVGYTNISGQFTITQPTGYQWVATHGPDTLRITEPPRTNDGEDRREEIWIFGCSYTYGWSLDDDETYPWLLQQKLPERKIVNFGIGGYGTINSFLQFREALQTRKTPALVVVAYGPLHDARNTKLRKTGKLGVLYSRTLGPRPRPYARLTSDEGLRLELSELEYREPPLMRHSALVHMLEKTYNDLEQRYFNSQAVSKRLLLEFANLAQKNDIRFVVAGIEQEGIGMLKDLTREGITTVDISVDLEADRNRNMPHDGHPSFKAHQAYAQRLFKLINESGLEY